ncbi:MAG: DUF456 domain-containing protein [Acidimicrobiia bacterium]
MFLGLGGIVVPILPGLTLQVAAVILWAVAEGSPMGWVVAGVSVAVAGVATVLKYTRPGRRLKGAGVPTRVLAVAMAAAIIGFFVVPVAGAVLGFVLALYVFERARVGRERAWPSTKAALIAIAQSIGIELAGGLLILILFAAAIFLT